MWQFVRRMLPELLFHEVFELACEGRCLSGSTWDHILGYRNASKANPETVLFLRCCMIPAVGAVTKLARFVGQPLISPDEEEAGVVHGGHC
uniref:Sulfotransferase n=1 Tax=Oryza nivara TaxID=4536 RepID=A0A0E0JBS2_ORYNI